MMLKVREQENRNYPIVEDMRFQRASWALERATWTMLLIVIIAALAGFASRGIASYAKAGESNAPIVQYERFERETRRVRFTIRLVAANSGELALHLDRAFAESYEIDVIHPHPLRTSSGSDGFDLTFAPAADRDVVIDVQARPRRWGLLNLRIASGVGETSFRVFVYP